MFKGNKGLLLFLFPLKSHMLFNYLIKRCNQGTKIRNKPPIETS